MDWGEVIGGPRVWARDLAVAVAAGLFLAFLGPFDSYRLPLEERILYCVGIGVLGSLIVYPLMRLALRLGPRAGLPEPFVAAAALAVIAVPVAALVHWVGPLLRVGSHAAPPPPVTLYFQVLAIVLPLGLAMYLVRRLLEARTPAAAPADAPPRLFARLPAHLGREILALQAEDHYVRVHTAKGSTLLLMRLADAVAELDGLEGLRVHRSWWVARAAVAAVKPEGRRLTLILANGVAAPVTREAVPQVRKAGWI